MCPNGPEHILYAIDSANRRYGKNGWAVLRLSMGLIGVILRCGDMDAFVKYTVDHMYDNLLPLTLSNSRSTSYIEFYPDIIIKPICPHFGLPRYQI